MNIAQLRANVREAFEQMEAALRAINDAGGDADLDALERDLDDAKATHERAVKRLDDAQAIEEARAALPVEPVEDDTDTAKRGKVEVVDEPLTYERTGPSSFIRDLYLATRPGEIADSRAVARLERHREEMRTEGRLPTEERAINSTDGTGGEFVPPLWLQDEWIALAKAGRVTADALRKFPLPAGTDTINFPTVTGPASVATQADGGAVSSTDLTTGSYSVGVKTVAGQQDLSQQLLDRSVPGIDVVIYEELTGRYAIALDQQVLAGSGSGANAQGLQTLASVNSDTFAGTTVQAYYSKIAGLVQQIWANRLMPPSAVIMHPRRWAWILAASDTQNRPLVVPTGPAFNQPAILKDVAPQGVVGTILGLPVLTDPNITTTNGAGTNEDITYVLRLEDLWLMEDNPIRTRILYEVLSGTLQVRIQLYNYFAVALGRYPKSVARLTGSGLVAPTF